MTAAVVVLAVVVALVPAVHWLANRPTVLRARALRVVVVTLKSGITFRGVLASSDRDALVLKRAEALGDATVPVDGELIVLRSEVDYIQAP